MATKSLIHYLIIFLLLVVSGFIHQQQQLPLFEISKQESSLNFKKEILLTAHLGLKRLISSILWIKTLIESDHVHYKKNDLNDWMYLRFKTIIELDPYFKQAYIFGGIYLSVIKDDDQGAKEIYDRGLEKFPDEYELLLNGGFHYYFELKDHKRAYELLKQIKDHPRTPFFFKSLIATLASQNNEEEVGIHLLQAMLSNMEPGFLRDKTEEKLKFLLNKKKEKP